MTQSIAETNTETAKNIVVRLDKISQELTLLSPRIFKLTCAALTSTLVLWAVAEYLLSKRIYLTNNLTTAIQIGCVFSILLGYSPIFLLSSFEKKTQRGYVALSALEDKLQLKEVADTQTAENGASNIDFSLHKEGFLKSANVWPFRGPFTTMWYLHGRFRFADAIYLIVNIAVVLSSTYLLISTFPVC